LQKPVVSFVNDEHIARYVDRYAIWRPDLLRSGGFAIALGTIPSHKTEPAVCGDPVYSAYLALDLTDKIENTGAI
jgi:hypothetical protein